MIQKSNFFFKVLIITALVVGAGARICMAELTDTAWVLVDTRDSIATYHEKNPSEKIVAVRGKSVLDVSPEIVLSVLIDANYQSQKEWVPDLIDFRILKQDSIFDRILYVYVDIPWPAKDRDFVYHARIMPQPDGKTVWLDYRSVAFPFPEKDGVVRGMMKTLFIITSRDNGKRTGIDLRASADPRGVVPKWVVNFAQRSYSYKMLKRVKERVYAKKDKVAITAEFRSLFNDSTETEQ